MTETQAALRDIFGGIRRWRLCLSLGWSDTKARYHRSVLGPLWLTLGTAVLVGGLGFIWSTLWGLEVSTFFPYMTAGLITWQMITSAIVEGSSTFIARGAVIRNVQLPFSVHALRSTIKIFITFAHTFLVYIGVALVFGVPITWSTLAFLPGLALVFVNAVWVTILMGIVGARYRDFPAIIDAILPLVFFLTPVMWLPEMLGRRQIVADANPFTHFIAIIRDPLMGKMPDLLSYGVVLGVTVVGCLISFRTFRANWRRIVFWI